MRTSLTLKGLLLRSSGVLLFAAAAPAFADDQAAPAPAAAPAAATPPAPFLKISGHVEGGITTNLDSQGTNPPLNWGHLFTDRANQPVLNQAMLTIEHPIDSSAKTANFGFRIQGVYGSDARVTHTLGLFNNTTNNINQFDLFEAHVDAHLPILASGGMDIKAGIYPTLEGAEVMDGTGNFFYSHNYIFNFGVPLKHTGVMTVTHFSHGVDIYVGVDSGVNTSFGFGGDNNGAPAFHGGIGFTIGKNVTVLATTHIGPEDARGSVDFNGKVINVNSALRYLNDIVITAKIGSKLVSTTDINYIRDDGYKVSGGGISEQLVYTLTDQVSLGLREEIWDDANNYFVSAFPGTHDYVLNEKGLFPASNTTIFAPNTPNQDTTYSEVTFGLNWKPKIPAYTKNFSLLIRPEARFDVALNKNSRPFLLNTAGFGTKKGQMTFGIDMIVGF